VIGTSVSLSRLTVSSMNLSSFLTLLDDLFNKFDIESFTFLFEGESIDLTGLLKSS
jgi:hypothetical protein